MAQTYLLIALGGAVGANARFVAATLVATRWGTRLPWGTLLINVTGSFLLGLSLAVPALGTGSGRAPLAIGFCGGYTTFRRSLLRQPRSPKGASVVLPWRMHWSASDSA